MTKAFEILLYPAFARRRPPLRRPDRLHAADVVIAVVMEAVGQVAVAEGIAQVAHGFLDGVLRLEAQHPLNLVRIDVVGADAIP